VAVLLTFGAEKLSKNLDKMGINQAQNLDFSEIPTVSLVIAIIFYAIVFLGFVAVFITLLYAFYRSTEKENRLDAVSAQLGTGAISDIAEITNAQAAQDISVLVTGKDDSKFSIAALMCVLPGLILILLTFVGQILELMNVNSGIIYEVLKTLWLA
jgi:hypothetical protein